MVPVDVPPAAVVTLNPVQIEAPGRARPLQVRVTAPASGQDLPVIVFSHGDAYSKDDYLPLTEYWARNGFVVIQPTHLDSRSLGIPREDPIRKDNWRIRAEDVKRVMDALPALEGAVPGLKGRVDADRIVVAGHSFGGYTAEIILGATVTDPTTGQPVDRSDPRVKAAVLLAPPGGGAKGADLAGEWKVRGAYLNRDWSRMTRPALVIAGDADQSPITVRDWRWQTDAYRLSPGGKCLLVLKGAKHFLGGVHWPRSAEDMPDAVAMVQESTLAFMKTAVDPKAMDWSVKRAELIATPAPAASFECD